jgi:hypothetical protein
MDGQQARPRRNWRGYLKEYLVVVLGVATALAGEQAVERWREHRQYLESREAIRNELANNFSVMSQRAVISACVAKRIAEVGALLDKAERHETFDPPRWIGDASSGRFRFVAEVDAGNSGLFAPGEQRRFGNVYSFMHSIDTEMDRERQAWARLQPLEGRRDAPPEMIANLREALAQARFEDARIVYLLGFARLYAEPLALSIPTFDPRMWPQTWSLCVPMDTPRDEALRRSAYNMDLVRRIDAAQ